MKPAFQGGGRSYGGGGAINNSNQCIVRERLSSNNLVRRWNDDGGNTILGRSYEGDFDSAIFWMDLNDSGLAVYPALTGGASFTTLFMASADGDATPIAQYSGTVFARPSLSNDGTAVYRDDQDRLVLNSGSGDQVIDSSAGIERHPGISGEGNEVGWIAGTAVFHATPGASYAPVKVAEVDDTWASFDGNSRVGAAWVEDACPGGKDPSLVVFVGVLDGVNGVQLATLQDGQLVGIQTLVKEGDVVGGVTLNSFSLFDPISANGTVVVRSETSAGSALVRLTPEWPE